MKRWFTITLIVMGVGPVESFILTGRHTIARLPRAISVPGAYRSSSPNLSGSSA